VKRPWEFSTFVDDPPVNTLAVASYRLKWIIDLDMLQIIVNGNCSFRKRPDSNPASYKLWRLQRRGLKLSRG
jgi:hypothetical protein